MTFCFHAPKRPIRRIFIHCSASDNPHHDDVRVIREWHVKGNHWDDIGYHYYITKAGVIQRGRNLEWTPAAQAGHNTHTIAICLGGLNAFTQDQFDALRDLCDAIHAELPMATFHGHREVNRHKTCPNFDYRKIVGINGRGELT